MPADFFVVKLPVCGANGGIMRVTGNQPGVTNLVIKFMQARNGGGF